MKKLSKILICVSLALILALAGLVAIPYYVYGIDIFDRSGWTTDEDGRIRYLDYYGDPLIGWQQLEDNWYYFDPSDAGMVTGWLQLDSERYYLKSDGTRHTGWLDTPEGVYYLNPEDATLSTGWLPLEEGRYFLDETGRRHTGWLDQQDRRYYLDDRGLMVTGWLEYDQNRYFFQEDGVMASGWLDTPEGRRYLDETGVLRSGWTDTPEGRFYLSPEGMITTGWLDIPEGIFYLDENGQPVTGWLQLEERKYYLSDTGLITGDWLELDGHRYYFREDGVMAVGKVVLEDQAYYFTSQGKFVLLVNRWNPMPEDYEVELVKYKGWEIAKSCYDDLCRMLEDLGKVGYYEITSAYRNIATQQSIWNNRMSNYLASGYSQQGAYSAVLQSVAIPGTSEHHLGLAVDLAANTNVHGWLAENSWRYGFILRYPEGKTAITGIIHEPWHFRYVGLELAQELRELGLTLEEYMDILTDQAGYGGGTASNPDNHA